MASSDTELTEIDQHSSDSIAFRESFQCPDELYLLFRLTAMEHLREEHDFPDHLEIEDVQLRRFMFEDGVVSFDATHPYITHESEYDHRLAELIKDAEKCAECGDPVEDENRIFCPECDEISNYSEPDAERGEQ